MGHSFCFTCNGQPDPKFAIEDHLFCICAGFKEKKHIIIFKKRISWGHLLPSISSEMLFPASTRILRRGSRWIRHCRLDGVILEAEDAKLVELVQGLLPLCAVQVQGLKDKIGDLAFHEESLHLRWRREDSAAHGDRMVSERRKTQIGFTCNSNYTSPSFLGLHLHC